MPKTYRDTQFDKHDFDVSGVCVRCQRDDRDCELDIIDCDAEHDSLVRSAWQMRNFKTQRDMPVPPPPTEEEYFHTLVQETIRVGGAKK